MIAQLTGNLVRSEANSLVLDVNGVGYLLFVPTTVLVHLPPTGDRLTVQTHLVTRGQPDFDMTLYGFRNLPDLHAFKLLIAISGVGPKVALAILSNSDVSDLARALSTNDTRVLTKIPGVGPKMAQKLCLELGDKMATFAFETRTERMVEGQQTAEVNAAYEDAIEALVGLGYSRADARKAVDRALANAPDRATTSALVTGGLALLNTKR